MAHLGELSGRLGRRIVFAFDDHLRRVEGIYAYSQDPNCVVRISRGLSRKECVLTDGTLVRAGDPLLELHWWNEHIGRLAGTGSSLNWGLQFYRHTYHSVLALAHYLETSPDLADVVALHGETTFPNELSFQHHAHAFRRLGFELVTLPSPATAAELLMHYLRHFHVWALTWASNPASLRRKGPCAMVRCELWISRQGLLERCARPGSPGLPVNGEAAIPEHGAGSERPRPESERHPTLPRLSPVRGALASGADPWTLLRARMRSLARAGNGEREV